MTLNHLVFNTWKLFCHHHILHTTDSILSIKYKGMSYIFNMDTTHFILNGVHCSEETKRTGILSYRQLLHDIFLVLWLKRKEQRSKECWQNEKYLDCKQISLLCWWKKDGYLSFRERTRDKVIMWRKKRRKRHVQCQSAVTQSPRVLSWYTCGFFCTLSIKHTI